MSFWPFSLFDEDASWLTTAVVASAVGFFVFTIRKWKQRPPVVLPPKVSRKRQAIPIEEESGAFKSGLLVDTNKQVMETMWPEINTLYQLFLRGLEISENNRCLGYRPEKKAPYTFISYAETFRRSQNIGSAFVNVLNLQPGNETKVGIYARNSTEWFICCLASVRFSIVVVPLYDTLGPEAAKFIVQQTEMQAIVVDDLDKLEKLLTNAYEMPTLRHIVLINHEGMGNDVIERANAANIQIHKFDELLQIGEANIATDVEPKPDDLYIICYTSGTTGNPKGVMLSHRNVIANVTGVMKIIESFIPAINNSNQLTISYLPLSHMFEQVVHWSVLSLGGSIGYFSGDVRTLMDDMQALKPTIFPTVPRLLNRFYDLLQKLMDKPNLFMRALFRLAYYRKLAIVKSGIVQRDSFWDRLVFQKFQDQVGGSIQLVVTGSAPISGEVLDACRVAFGCHVLEGYGQTETCAMATLTWPYETVSQHCGGPACCTKLKLEDVSELNYFSSERKGEILIKGPSVTRGYYKDPEKTSELFDQDGYLHTGDIGYLLPNGTLQIIDRKKHIFKLAQGEYVAPEKIESVYVKSPYVQQVYVDGDSLENYLIAIVVPESHELRNWYKTTTGNEKSLEEICKEKMARDHVLADILTLGKQNKLNSIEQIKTIWLEPTPWSVENGMLTPTFKSKRPKLREHYRTVISDLYKGK
ncbi:Arachidonate--CoA ligase [Aphelenchoides besseyi]|nr:Arachidonate--CoA ligase [Aphelenchoides besseyi]